MITSLLGYVCVGGMRWNKVMFHCLDCKKHGGMEPNHIYCILFHHLQSFLLPSKQWNEISAPFVSICPSRALITMFYFSLNHFALELFHGLSFSFDFCIRGYKLI